MLILPKNIRREKVLKKEVDLNNQVDKFIAGIMEDFDIEVIGTTYVSRYDVKNFFTKKLKSFFASSIQQEVKEEKENQQI